MENCLGVISGNGDKNFGALCKNRPVFMLPYGGRYRVIDFTLSNMVNHGIRTVAVYTGDKVRSTMDHLGTGRPWDLNRRFNGLFLFPPVNNNDPIPRTGDVAEYFNTMPFFEESKEESVLIINPTYLGTVNLDDAYKHYKESDADITILYKKQVDPWGEYINCDKVHLNKDGSVITMGLNLATEKEFNMYIGITIMKKKVFMDLVKSSAEKGDAAYLKQAVMINKDIYKINSFEFDGHIESIRSIKAYYDANLNLLNRKIARELFFDRGTIFTKSKDEPSTLYMETSVVKNSLVANGCIIEGEVENSIIFRGVHIGKGAVVKNSIVMQKSEIKENAIVVNTIMDKHSIIGERVRIAGSSVMPYVVEKYQEIKEG